MKSNKFKKCKRLSWGIWPILLIILFIFFEKQALGSLNQDSGIGEQVAMSNRNIILKTNNLEYFSGEKITFTFTNNTAKSIFSRRTINEVHQLTEKEWEYISTLCHFPHCYDDRYDPIQELKPGESFTTYFMKLHPEGKSEGINPPAGTYRLPFSYYTDPEHSQKIDIFSNEFLIASKKPCDSYAGELEYIGSQVLNKDGDPLPESLRIDISINVKEKGEYAFRADLEANQPDSNTNITYKVLSINAEPGEQILSFEFDGTEIKQRSLSGDYSVFIEPGENGRGEYKSKRFSIGSYNGSDFGPATITFLPDITQSHIDSDGDQVSDTLRLTFFIDNKLAMTDTFSCSIHVDDAASAILDFINIEVITEPGIKTVITDIPFTRFSRTDAAYISEIRLYNSTDNAGRRILRPNLKLDIPQSSASQEEIRFLSGSVQGDDLNKNGLYEGIRIVAGYTLFRSWRRYDVELTLKKDQLTLWSFTWNLSGFDNTLSSQNKGFEHVYPAAQIKKKGMPGPYTFETRVMFAGKQVGPTKQFVSPAYKLNEFE
ncbi:MAG: hypothetical protein P9X22_06725 [Candidatus Zapsychrus exili]|nr:hypothetical protein [Candidatus Zapsychrus exili]